MTKMPAAISSAMLDHVLSNYRPAWIEMRNGKAIAWGGNFSTYGIETIRPDHDVESLFPSLTGMLDGLEEPLSLLYMELYEGIYTHVHLFHKNHSDWLLLLDVTALGKHDESVQQTANEHILHAAQQDKIMTRYLGYNIASRLASNMPHLQSKGERRYITTMFTDVRSFTPFNESHDPEVVMKTINQYLDAMLGGILDAGGVIDKIVGDGVMAVFGILPHEESSEQQAMNAAQMIQMRVAKLNKQRENDGLLQLGVGIGIASGEAVLGVLGSHDRRTISAIGPNVNLAARLESQAKAGEIALDYTTFSAIKEQRLCIEEREVSLKGIGEMIVYVFTPCDPFIHKS